MCVCLQCETWYLDLVFIYKSSFPSMDFGKGFKRNCPTRSVHGIKPSASLKELSSNQKSLQQIDIRAKFGPIYFENG